MNTPTISSNGILTSNFQISNVDVSANATLKSLKDVETPLIIKDTYKGSVSEHVMSYPDRHFYDRTGTMDFELPEGVEILTDEEVAKGPSLDYFITHPSIYTSERKASINLTTTQGDKVTFTYGRSEFNMNYLSTKDGYVPGLARMHELDNSFVMEVEGDLNEKELQDIETFRESLQGAIEGFLSRQTMGITDEDFDMAEYEALTEYSTALYVATSNMTSSRAVKGYYSRPTEGNPPPQTRTGTSPVPPTQSGYSMGEASAADESPQSAQTASSSPVAKKEAKPGENDIPLVSQLVRLNDVTDREFMEISLSPEGEPYRDALSHLKKKFSGMIERMMEILGDESIPSHRINEWI